MGGLQWWHIAIVVLVGLLLFGGKRLPSAARGLGQSMRILKTEVKAMNEEHKTLAPVTVVAEPVNVVAAPVAAPVVAQTLPAQRVPNAGVITIEGRPVSEVR